MECKTCKNKSELTEEAKAVRVAQDMAQRYRLLCGAVIALVIGFVVMAACMVYAVTNAQQIANEAVLEALYTVSEMEVTSETNTTVTQDTGEGNGNNIYQQENGTYNESGVDRWPNRQFRPQRKPL